jgi:hypothetical protein
MKTVQRYDFEYCEDAPHDSGMEKSNDGEYVDFSDYSALEKEKEELAKLAGEFAEELINMKIKPYGMNAGGLFGSRGLSYMPTIAS